MTNSLAIYNQFDQLERAALALQKSGYFKDVTSQAQAIVKVMAGAELGLPPFASMSGIHIIQGKPVLGANILATLVKNDPRYNYQIKRCDNAACELTWFEDGKPVGSSSFTIEEAKAAGLTGKDNWTKYPSDMLFARAISRGARRYAPGVFGGSPVYTPDEMGQEVDAEGYIDAQVIEPPAATVKANDAPVSPPAETPQAGLMDYEQAKAVTNSEGVPYGDLDTAKLTHMSNKMGDLLRNPGSLTQEKIDEYTFKRDAIRSILASRQQ